MHPNHLRTELVREHDRIAKRLLELAEENDAQALQRAWASFETELVSHLDAEEKELFPLVEPFHSEEVKALRLEHESIRRQVAELGPCCDLHAPTRAAMARLAEMLRGHAEREDQGLYRWVDEVAPIDTRRHFFRLLSKAARADPSTRT
jgi:hemerythrin-like domain-containing protein